MAPGDCDNGLMGCSFKPRCRQNLMFGEHLDFKMDLKMERESLFQMAEAESCRTGRRSVM